MDGYRETKVSPSPYKEYVSIKCRFRTKERLNDGNEYFPFLWDGCGRKVSHIESHFTLLKILFIVGIILKEIDIQKTIDGNI